MATPLLRAGPLLDLVSSKRDGRMSLHLEIDAEGVADCLRTVGLSVWTVDKPSMKKHIEAFFEAWEYGGLHLVHRDDE